MGAPDEVASMMDSFSFFVRNYLYVDSSRYPLVDRTTGMALRMGYTPMRTTDVP
jgi:hypothetical protein